MKKILTGSAAVLFAVLFMNSVLFAGTLKVGAQSSYIMWDSGMAKMNIQVVQSQLDREMDQGVLVLGDFASVEGVDIGDPETTGFIYGPVLSYETDEKKWEFRAAVMWFGNYTTSVDSTVSATAKLPGFPLAIPVTLPINTELEIEYRDIDLRARRMLTDTFGVFAGYKFQSYATELKSDYSFTFDSGSSMESSVDFELNSYMHMLYAGVAYVKPLSERFTFNGNLGFGLPVAGSVEQDLRISGSFFNEDITNDGGKMTMAYLFFGEVEMGFKLGSKVNLRLGYQYRYFTVKVEEIDLDADGNANESSEEVDVFHGVTFAAEYIIDI